MLNFDKPIIWTIGLALAVATLLVVWRYFTRPARERRRRTRSYGRVVSRKNGLWVKLAVKTKRPD